MNIIFFISVILKGIGAVLEVLFQIMVTRELGVDGYGTYSTWINAADLIFWVFFSALTKCNTFYLSVSGTSMKEFKKKYYGRYVIPVLLILSMLVKVGGKLIYCLIFVITALEIAAMDQSSTLLAQNQQKISLIGEYVLGRGILLLGFEILNVTGGLTPHSLVILYGIQFLVIILVFCAFRMKRLSENNIDISENISVRKWRSYQRADIMQSLIGQVPVVLQYFGSGAFEAGVVSVVLTVKKLINFISGPTAKVFLPEFSRLYRVGEKEKIRDCYASIMRIQMIFAAPLSVVLIGYPDVILQILDKKLLQYSFLFMACSAVFIFAATLGPCSGVLQMTGNEKWDNQFREIAMLVMLGIMFLFRKNNLFVLYGLCAQALLEESGKYYYVSKWMGESPVKIKRYFSWWICPGIFIVISYWRGYNQSFVWMIVSAGITFLISVARELQNLGN